MRYSRRGRRRQVQGGAVEVPVASAPRDPALVPRDAAETRASGPPEERGPGPRAPVRKLVLAMLGVTVVVVAFISSYASALGKPSPRHVPVAVSAPPGVLGKLDASPQLRVYPVPGLARARMMVEHRAVYGALLLPRTGPATLLVANGGGHSVEAVLMQVGQQVATSHGTTLTTVDVAPTSPNDPDGTVEFYCIAFLFLGGAIGATVLGRVAGPVRGLRGALERLGLVMVYAASLSVVVTLLADIALGDLTGHFGFLFLTLSLYVLAVCLAVTGLSALAGPLASIVLVLVLIILGNPSSGGPVPRPLLNGFYSGLNPVMLQGAALSVVRGVQYFGGREIDLGLLCLLIWALAGLALLGATVFRDALRTWPSGREHWHRPIDRGRDGSSRGPGNAGSLRGQFPVAPALSIRQWPVIVGWCAGRGRV
jgi:hypothetical protein